MFLVGGGNTGFDTWYEGTLCFVPLYFVGNFCFLTHTVLHLVIRGEFLWDSIEHTVDKVSRARI